ncbi:hypothetical protein C0992_005410 [Termitomyces sp. T32_za158]|nr:hypothetical protein C0992_005410 [Termitomyces sp. T32_za158]
MVAMFSILALLDRANIGNALLAGLQEDLHMTNYQFTIVLMVTFIPYLLMEIPINLILKAVGPHRLLPTMLTLWGTVATLQGVVRNQSDLLACRFFLGLFEGGLFSGIITYLSFWYPRQKLQWRASIFLSTSSLTGAFSGLLAYAIVRMDGVGNRPGWAWIFIVEGLFSVAFGLFAYIVLPRSPAHARFLTEVQKKYVTRQLRHSGAIDHDERRDLFSVREVWQAFTLPQVWMLSIIAFFSGTVAFALGYFTPSIVAGLGYTNTRAQLFSVPPNAAGFVGQYQPYISDRFGARGGVIIFSNILATIGLAMFLASDNLHVKYGSLFFVVTGGYSTSPALFTWIVNNASPYTRRATSNALCSIMFNLGGLFATWLLGTLSPGPLYRLATIVLLVFSALIIVTASINVVYLLSQNKIKAQIRATTSRENETPGLGDRSAWFVYKL